jgi:hypothetical protein
MIRTLSCHCGKIRLETNAELGQVTDCNCRTCTRAGLLSWRVDRRQVRLATPRSGLSTYVWRCIDEGTHFCPTCGTVMCRTGPDGYFVLNAKCLDDVDVHTFSIRQYDGLTDVPGGDMPPLADHP